jgi:cytidine deaminase
MATTPTQTKPGHSRHDTALIHGLSTGEVQKLSEKSIEAKAKAYCKALVAGSEQMIGI